MQSALALPSAVSLSTGSLAWSLLGLLFAAVPVLVWARTARTRKVGTAVGAVLAVAGGLLVAVQHGWVTGIPRADAHLLLGVTAPLVIWCGVRWERARRGLASEEWERRRSRSAGVLGAYVGLTVIGSLFAFLLAGGADVPPKGAVPALPPGLVALAEDTSCGSSSCARTVTVGSRDGLTNAEIIRALDHPAGWTCRANGWLLDRRKLCVNVAEANGKVQLNVSLSDLV
ncbi:MFS transporter [Streptomyces bacillaris]|uniref:MFS transporter n=1 Tax=Streptomyces bacillaris TaxID=68179 RepID=UPI0034605EA5